MAAVEKIWWKSFFNEYRPIFVDDKTETKEQLALIIDKLKLKKGSQLLDCPCGFGRVSIPLAQKGIKVTAVDITESYLEEIREKISKKNLPLKTINLDMRKLPFENKFDAVVNLRTSIGYFKTESENQKVISQAFKSLKPGGRFMIHVRNRDWVIRYFQPGSWMMIGDIKLLEKRSFNSETSRMTASSTFIKDGVEKTLYSDIRLYSPHELVNMCAKAGFENIECYGSPTMDEVSINRMNLYIIADKPKQGGGKK